MSDGRQWKGKLASEKRFGIFKKDRIFEQGWVSKAVTIGKNCPSQEKPFSPEEGSVARFVSPALASLRSDEGGGAS